MFTSIKLKITSRILLLTIMLPSFPGAALGYDVLGRLRNFVSTQVKTSDKIINANEPKIKASFQKAADWYEGKWLGGLSLLERKTGLSEENSKLYRALKSYNLLNLGFNAGVVNGVGKLAAETYSLVAKLPTAPERIVDFGFNYAQDPEKYQAMASNGAQAVAGIALNAVPLLVQGKNAYLGAAQDPLKFGHLNGEGAAFVGSFLIGGGQVKALSSASKVEKAAGAASTTGKAKKAAGVASAAGKNVAGTASLGSKLKEAAGTVSLAKITEKIPGATSVKKMVKEMNEFRRDMHFGVQAPIISSPLTPLTIGLGNLLRKGEATSFVFSKNSDNIELYVSGVYGKLNKLGSVEKGQIKYSDEIDLTPYKLRALSREEVWAKHLQYNSVILPDIKALDDAIFDMFNNEIISLQEATKCNELIINARKKAEEAAIKLERERDAIKEVQINRVYNDVDGSRLKEKYTPKQLNYLAYDLESQIKSLENFGAVSKGLRLQYKKLLGEVRVALKKEEAQSAVATSLAAKAKPIEQKQKINSLGLYLLDAYGEKIYLGLATKGAAELSTALNLTPQKLRVLTKPELQKTLNNYLQIRKSITVGLNAKILKMLNDDRYSLEALKNANQILDQSLIKTDEAIAVLRKEIKSINALQRYKDLDYKEIFSKYQLNYLEKDLVEQIKTLEEGGAVSKGLLLEQKKLLGQVRNAQKGKQQIKKKNGLEDSINAAFNKIIPESDFPNLEQYFSPFELGKLVGEIKKENKYFTQEFVKAHKQFFQTDDVKLLDRMEAFRKASKDNDGLLNQIKSLKKEIEERLAGSSVTGSLLAKDKNDLRKLYTPEELEKLELEVGDDIGFLNQLGTDKDILNLNLRLLDRIKEARTNPIKTEEITDFKKLVINPDDFLVGVNLKGLSPDELKQLEQQGRYLLQSLEEEKTKVWQKYNNWEINEEEGIALLSEIYEKQDRLNSKLELLAKYFEKNGDI